MPWRSRPMDAGCSPEATTGPCWSGRCCTPPSPLWSGPPSCGTTSAATRPVLPSGPFPRWCARPEQSLPLLREQVAALRPVVSRTPVNRLIAQLGSDQFEERQRASKILRRLGKVARKEILQALQAGPALDLERQLRDILEEIEEGWSKEELRQLRLVEVLERLGSPEARQVLLTLAGGAGSERVGESARSALRRLEALRDNDQERTEQSSRGGRREGTSE